MLKQLILPALILPALMIACGTAPSNPETLVAVTPAKPKPVTPTIRPVGAVELSVDTRDSSIGIQALSPKPDANVTFPTAGRATEVLDVGANRYIMARFPVTANVAFNNLTLVAYQKTGNAASSAFKNFQSFSGTPSTGDVYSLRPAHGMSSGSAVDPNKADLQVLTTAEATSLTTAAQTATVITGGEYALEYGYVARRCTANCATATPTWVRGFAVNDSGQITVAVRVPQTGDVTSGYRFTMTFIVSDESTTQYSQSLEEIAANTVAGISQANAAITGAASVRVLCNSGYASANKLFILGARAAGNGSTPLAQYGAQFYRNATAANFSVIPNTQGSFAAGVGLAPLYTALNGASLTFGGGGAASSTNGGDAIISSNGGFSFDPKAGGTTADTMKFTVSDDQGCSAAPQTAPISLAGPVIWYINSTVATTGDGRKTAPFKTIAEGQAASSANQTLFTYSGSYGALTLKANQNLIGQFEGLAVQGNLVVPVSTVGATVIEPAAGTIPTLTAAAGDTLTLANGSSIVRGVKLGGVAGSVALKGSAFGTLTMSNSEINTPGQAMDLSTGALNATLKAVSSGAGSGAAPVNGIKLNALTGTGLTVTGDGVTAGSGGTIQRSSAEGILISDVSGVSLQWMRVQNTANLGALISTSGTNATTLVFRNNAIVDPVTTALRVNLFGAGNSTFDISSNTIGGATAGSALGTDASGINVEGCGSGVVTCTAATQFQGRINNNTIRMLATAAGIGTGIDVNQQSQGTMLLESKGNTITNYGTLGFDLSALNGGGANLQATVQNNTVTPAASASPLQGARVISGTSSALTNTLCLNFTGNIINTLGTPAPGAIQLRQRIGSTFNIQGLTGLGTLAANVQTVVNGLNVFATLGTQVAAASTTTAVNYTAATCTLPSF